MAALLNERDIAFQLYEVLNTAALLDRERYSDQTREDFDAVLATAQAIATEKFADHNARGDANEPQFDGRQVRLIPEVKAAWDAFAEAGFLAAAPDVEEGGLQLPEIVLRAAMAWFSAANISSAGYPFLTIGAANLLRTFGDEALKQRFLAPMMAGRFSGTMALTEPGQGSALADIRTRAVPAEDGSFRIFGNKMFISAGDHELTENIVHMVLARIEGAPPGVKGISLFLVPKFLVDELGQCCARNDVVLGGLLHKMGYRGTTSTVLNFGEQGGATGYLLGKPHHGMQHMFQMMNEARIGVGLGAACIAYRGYLAALEYARERPQGRLPGNRDPLSPQVRIIEHADVRRMLLAQKCYAEGALCLCLFGSALFEDSRTAATGTSRARAHALLELLTPVIKSWPSRYGCAANELAIQVHGGAGYTREYLVEQLYRDQRLNPIHEGTEAIHGIDLLGRKTGQPGYSLLFDFAGVDIERASGLLECRAFAEPLRRALDLLDAVTGSLRDQIAADPDRGLANATVYLDLFGRVVMAWIWLKQAISAEEGLGRSVTAGEQAFYRGKLQAARYFCEWELPQMDAQAHLLGGANPVPFAMQDDWF
ncbi:acyl-CoA dehydrogenase [Haliea sp. E17]|uniref:acyl-CoA dehydrogenase n=1 Tax=Haliea sp. E17 TaxID=3401576 RepID=UPI003AABC017